jgi:DNA-binding CsgD family transcriptional regulator
MANNYRNTRIPLRAKDGCPTSYFIVDENGNHTPVSRAECLAHDEKGAPLLVVDPDGAAVFRLPRTMANEQIARWNMRFIWNEEYHDQAHVATAVPLDSESDLPSRFNLEAIIEDAELLAALLSVLTEAERHLLNATVVEGKSERHVAAELGITKQAVNKRKLQVLKKLNAHLSSKGFL